jgi:hypothetical protein
MPVECRNERHLYPSAAAHGAGRDKDQRRESGRTRRTSRNGILKADDGHGWRVRAMIVVLWRAGLRVQEALALAEHDRSVEEQRRLLARRLPTMPRPGGTAMARGCHATLRSLPV